MLTNNDRIIITGGSGFIGTNLITALLEKKNTLLNIDKCKPKIEFHLNFWHKENILEKENIFKIFQEFQPTIVIHLAARTDTASTDINDYIDNTEGTKNIIDVVKNTPSVERIIITSTQYVYFRKEGSVPASDIEYSPHTAYGESKVLNEKYTREANLDCSWTIVRPTNVWGPWNMRYPNELFKMINQGFYFHPGKKKVMKSYAYVKNLVHQLTGIMDAERHIVDKQVFYLGDYPMDSYEWVNSFSIQLTNKNAIIIPAVFVKILAKIGDFLKVMNIKFPINTVRYLNMTTDYLVPMDKTISHFGLYSNSHLDNVKETVDWIYSNGDPFFLYWHRHSKKKL